MFGFDQIFRGYHPLEVIFEMVVIWACVYVVFRFLPQNARAGIIKGFAVLLVVLTVLIRILGETSDAFGRLNYLYGQFLGLVAILLIVVFQPELRQAMVRIGQARLFGRSQSRTARLVDALDESVEYLSKSQFGALIVIERNVGIGGLVEGGVPIDAMVGSRLLQAIFYPNSPLHDLAVVIRGDRIAAASVQLPLAEEGVVPAEYGSRHRAAVGISLEADCLAIVVSEETGNIAIAEFGQLHLRVPRDEFRDVLLRNLETDHPDAAHPEVTITDDSREGDDDPAHTPMRTTAALAEDA